MLPKSILERAFTTMATAKAMATLYEDTFKVVSKYVHATSRGHEAIQIAMAMQLLPQDYAFPYYRDEAMLLGIGMQPYDLMLQLMAKKDDPFSGGRTYYCHQSLNATDKPKIPHQSSATGMQAIPATGAAMGFWYKENTGIAAENEANFVGFLASNSSDNIYFKYASYRMALVYCISELRKRDPKIFS